MAFGSAVCASRLQALTQRGIRFSTRITPASVGSRFGKPFGENVQRLPADELDGRQRHRLLPPGLVPRAGQEL